MKVKYGERNTDDKSGNLYVTISLQ